MSYSLPPTVYKLDQLQLGALELRAHADSLRQRSATHRAAAAKGSPGVEGQVLLAGLPKAKQADAAAIEALAAELEAMIAHGARVTVTLAGLASHHLREELVGWLRANLKPNLIVDFHTNPDIAGGMMVRTTNRIHDFSFRRLLLEDPAAFTRVLGRV